jgi:Gentisate 1,2-dioxygenase
MEVLKRVDKQDVFRKEIEELAKQIEQDDLKVVTFMEYTTPPEKVKPKLIKFEKVLPLLERIAESGKIQEGVAKIMFFSPSTGRNKGLTPTMMAGFQLIKPGVSTKPTLIIWHRYIWYLRVKDTQLLEMIRYSGTPVTFS